MDKIWLVFMILFCIGVVFLGSCSKTEITNNYYNPIIYNYQSKEATFLKELNEYRDSLGLSKLKGESTLNYLAISHALWLSQNNITEDNIHFGYSDRQLQSKAKVFDEICAVNFIDNFQAYLNSVEHKAILEKPEFNYIGIGIINNCQCIELAKY